MPCHDPDCQNHSISAAAAPTLNRRSIVAALASTAALSITQLSAPHAHAEAGTSTAAQTPSSADDVRFMKIALDEARRGDYPFGAVIVKDGKILARGRNLGKTQDDPTAHGEMVAIRRFLHAHGAAALKGTTLYTSGEPCVMCMGAIIWCGIGRMVYAASVAQIAAKMNQINISSADIAAKAPWDPVSITGGVLADEAVPILAR
jgi:tRNA(adenine34) deaminase